MQEFKRGEEGMDAYVHFFDADYYILLENDFDIYFWRKLFEEILTSKKFEFSSPLSSPYFSKDEKNANGKNKLIEFSSTDVFQRSESIIIAWDSDYEILKEKNDKKKIITTYGYTIENTIFCPYRLVELILDEACLNRKDFDDILREINEWYLEISEKLKEFLIHNIAEVMVKEDKSKKKVMGRTSHDYIKNEYDIDLSKVEKVIDEIILTEEQKSKAIALCENAKLDKRYIISGHFWETLIRNKFSEIIRRRASKDRYRIAIDNLKKRANDKCKLTCSEKINCHDYNYLKDQIGKIIT